MKKLVMTLALCVLLIILLSAIIYTVDETEQVVVTQLGKPVKTVTEPGLQVKLPMIQKVNRFDDRLLEYDSEPSMIYTQDKKNLIIDNYARWRIIDPLKFMQTLRTEGGAQSRLDDIVYSVLREELGKRTLSEVISVNREKIMTVITQRCDESARALGIEIVDVKIKRADLPPENEKYVFDRMRAERSRMAKQYRSEGEEEALKIRADTDLEVAKINADAYQKAQQIKGEGDAEALKIYAQAYQQDSKFYQFIRTLEAYEKTLDKNTVMVLPPESEFFQYLTSGVK